MYLPFSICLFMLRLQEKSTASSRDSLLFCTQPDFTDLLTQPDIKPDFMYNILKCLSNALSCDSTLHNLKMTLKEPLLDDENRFLTQVSYVWEFVNLTLFTIHCYNIIIIILKDVALKCIKSSGSLCATSIVLVTLNATAF